MDIKELSIDAQVKAYNNFVKWMDQQGHEGGHTFTEFIETSEINGWEYDEQGNLI
ncbi:hypothetical protein 278BB001_267 [Bacillus phage 278BB001]|nr:hypothetical protein 010DV004_13 [Bacillus phage 010DV004]QZA69231.1 hypothetical protein 010DV005_13 [Bacillus phage 010DV005]QZA69799.1 hypothetical protein 043JT007_13 [Bacillus phage 043JT007]QZA70156.1 hypothetical protein 278BB001_5 [Bacillus phage 278BB001]QZA69210.1 hypothetical protein 010DV004_278 [Bacillus phage 010DV004]